MLQREIRLKEVQDATYDDIKNKIKTETDGKDVLSETL